MRTGLLLLVTLLMSASAALADGVYIPKIDPASEARDLTEPTQKAVIMHYKGTETLTLQVSFRGSASDFVWLVPTPATPKVERGFPEVFRNLHVATAPRIRYWLDANIIVQDSLGTFGKSRSAGSPERPAVDVLERKVVGPYATAVLRASREADLLEWLQKNGYRVPERMRPVLGDYVRRGWVFTAVRINTSVAKKTGTNIREASLEPLQLRFNASQPVYPLKVSSLNPGRTKVLLYVITDHFVTGPPMRTVCAVGRTGSGYVDYLVRQTMYGAVDYSAMRRARKTYHITKLSAELTPRQMTGDIVLVRTPSQREMPPSSVSPPFLENLGALVLVPVAFVFSFPVGLFILLACFIMAIVRIRKDDKFPWLLASLGVLVMWVPMSLLAVALDDWGYWPVGVTFLIVLALLLLRLTLRLQRRLKLS